MAVVGSNGQLGQDLMRVFGEAARGVTHQDLDVTDELAVFQAIQGLRPDWIINTAAFHKVDDCEANATLAFNVNALGAFNVARAATSVGAGIVFLSTDYVFGSEEERNKPYTEADCPGPLNVYGISKHAGECLVVLANPRHCIVRSAGLYGTATSRKGWTFPEIVLQKAKSGEQLRVVNDQVLSPTFTLDLARGIRELIHLDVRGVVHMTNAGQCSWFELARMTLFLAGVESDIEAIDSGQMPRRARRPQYSALRSIRLEGLGIEPLREWKHALQDYLHTRDLIR